MCEIDWEIVLGFCTLLVTIAALVVTFYFTRQLVHNDHERNRFMIREMHGKNIKTQLFNGLSLNDPFFDQFIFDIIKNNEDKFDLINQGIRELLAEHGEDLKSYGDFKSALTSAIKRLAEEKIQKL